MTKKQHITLLTSTLKAIANKHNILLEKKVTVNWDDDYKEVYFAITELPSKNRVVQALNIQKYIPMFMVLDIYENIRFDIDSEIVFECKIDKFNKGMLKRLEDCIKQNYEYKDLLP